MFMSSYDKHRSLHLRNAEKYLRYNEDLLRASSREELVPGSDEHIASDRGLHYSRPQLHRRRLASGRSGFADRAEKVLFLLHIFTTDLPAAKFSGLRAA